MNHPLVHANFRKYPAEAFFGLSGEILRHLGNCGATIEIVGTVLISMVSLLTQGVSDVVWPNGQKSPIGNSICIEARSGFGKTATLNLFKDSIERCLSRFCQADEKYSNFLIEDVTREAILESLTRLPVAGLLTDEVGQILRLFKHAATLVKPIDGSTVRNSRVSTGRKTIINPRLLMLLMPQPEVFDAIKDLLLAKGGVGLGNRLFFASCNHLIPSTSIHYLSLTKPLELAWDERVNALLKRTFDQIEKPLQERPVMLLSTQASQFLIGLSNEVSRSCLQGVRPFRDAEYASRHPERVLRLGTAFHVFEYGLEGEISLDTIMRAATIGYWYSEEFERMTFQLPKPTKVELDSIQLERAIINFSHITGAIRFEHAVLRTHSINFGVSSARFNNALADLGSKGKIRIFTHERKRFVELIIRPYHQGV